MRPSCSSFSSVIRATSRRTPSKPERTTALGVSSMMKSTPVRFSSARMLRPSRPMMRPFMSSEGRWTTDTVVSAAWPAARRCMTTERMLRTRRSASRLVSSSIWRTSRAASWRARSSTSESRICLAWETLRPATRSSSRRCSCLRSSSSSRWRSSSRDRSSSDLPRLSTSASSASSVRSRASICSSARPSSPRRSRSSASMSVLGGGGAAAAAAAPAMGAGCGLPVLVDPLATGRA